ncbi:MAG: HAMP domain-containing protein [Cardiobacteriaceae bacterium]|nr:HAMP domain-containing protein [Cardiobacteriaceae bacterium]
MNNSLLSTNPARNFAVTKKSSINKKKYSKFKFSFFLLLGIITAAASFFSIYLLAYGANNPLVAIKHYNLILICLAVSLLVLFLVICRQIFQLFSKIFSKTEGARLSLSFALKFLFVSAIPILGIFCFSWLFISYDIERIFNSDREENLEDAVLLADTAVKIRRDEVLLQSNLIADAISQLNYSQLLGQVEKLRAQANADEIAVFDHQGNLLAFANQDLSQMSSSYPSANELLRLREFEEVLLQFISDEDAYQIKILLAINSQNREEIYLQTIFSLPEQFNLVTNRLKESYRTERIRSYLQPYLSKSILMILCLIFLLTLLIVLGISILFGDAMSRPLRQLIASSKAAQRGDFSLPVKHLPNNDLGVLGNNFNAMLVNLHTSREVERKINLEISEQRNFLSLVLEHISACVFVFDSEKKILIANSSAQKIFTLPQDLSINNVEYSSLFQEFLEEISDAFDLENYWQKEITLSKTGKRLVLLSYAVKFITEGKNNTLLVAEDVTSFKQQQRNVAWEEVARRLAHEIKNPLTPIRLQAERLQRKLTDKVKGSDEERILDRATTTIINQVEAMQQMVSDFGSFAKPLELRQKKGDFGKLLREVCEMYQNCQITLNCGELPQVNFDAVQIRQVLHNILKNALEANEEKNIQIAIDIYQENQEIICEIEDDGTGFSDLSKDPFEPYVTTKVKGSGIGLAVVKKIIEEHGGKITAGKAEKLSGAKISFSLPLS